MGSLRKFACNDSNEFLYARFNEVQNERPGHERNKPLNFCTGNSLLFVCIWKTEEPLNAFKCFKAEQIANYIIWPKIQRRRRKKEKNERWQTHQNKMM